MAAQDAAVARAEAARNSLESAIYGQLVEAHTHTHTHTHTRQLVEATHTN